MYQLVVKNRSQQIFKICPANSCHMDFSSSKIQVVGTDNEGNSFTADWCTIVNYDGELPRLLASESAYALADGVIKSSCLNTVGYLHYYRMGNICRNPLQCYL